MVFGGVPVQTTATLLAGTWATMASSFIIPTTPSPICSAFAALRTELAR